MTSLSDIASRFRAELTSRIVAAISGALLMVILARLLNPDDYGLLFLSISIFTVISLFSKLGLAKSTARYISEYKNSSQSQIPYIIRFSLLMNIILITVVTALTILFNDLISKIVGESEMASILLFGSVFIFSNSIFIYSRIVLQGYEAIEWSSFIHIAGSLSKPIFAIGFVVLGFGTIGALYGYILGYFVGGVVGLYIIYVGIYKKIESAPAMEEGLAQRIAEYAIPLTATDTAEILDKEIDTILVGLLLSPVAVSFYVIGKQVTQLATTPMKALGFTLSPTLGAEKASGNIEHATKIFETAFVHSLLIYIPAAAGLLILSEPLVELVFGEEYLGAVPVLQVLAIYSILWAITRITSETLDFVGRAKMHAIVKSATSVLNVVLSVYLIIELGVVGAALATVFAYILYSISNLYLIYGVFKFRVRYVIKETLKITSVTIVMSIVVFNLADYVDNILNFIGVVIVGVTIWLILSVLLGVLDVNKIRTEYV
jgi:O-antigen/teichoic acid export membrane protein